MNTPYYDVNVPYQQPLLPPLVPPVLDSRRMFQNNSYHMVPPTELYGSNHGTTPWLGMRDIIPSYDHWNDPMGRYRRYLPYHPYGVNFSYNNPMGLPNAMSSLNGLPYGVPYDKLYGDKQTPAADTSIPKKTTPGFEKQVLPPKAIPKITKEVGDGNGIVYTREAKPDLYQPIRSTETNNQTDPGNKKQTISSGTSEYSSESQNAISLPKSTNGGYVSIARISYVSLETGTYKSFDVLTNISKKPLGESEDSISKNKKVERAKQNSGAHKVEGDKQRPEEKGTRPHYTRIQQDALENFYRQNPNAGRPELEKLAKLVDLKYSQVKMWFLNKKRKGT